MHKYCVIIGTLLCHLTLTILLRSVFVRRRPETLAAILPYYYMYIAHIEYVESLRIYILKQEFEVSHNAKSDNVSYYRIQLIHVCCELSIKSEWDGMRKVINNISQ